MRHIGAAAFVSFVSEFADSVALPAGRKAKKGLLMLSLRPMTEEEFTVFREEGIEDYAAERARNFGTTLEEEHETSVRQYAELLPEGIQSPRQRLWSVIDEAGTVVGSLWVEVNEEHHRAFIFYI